MPFQLAAAILDFHNSSCFLVQVAGHGQLGPSGQVRQERVQVPLTPKDIDNCGDLVDVVQARRRQESCWPPD